MSYAWLRWYRRTEETFTPGGKVSFRRLTYNMIVEVAPVQMLFALEYGGTLLLPLPWVYYHVSANVYDQYSTGRHQGGPVPLYDHVIADHIACRPAQARPGGDDTLYELPLPHQYQEGRTCPNTHSFPPYALAGTDVADPLVVARFALAQYWSETWAYHDEALNSVRVLCTLADVDPQQYWETDNDERPRYFARPYRYWQRQSLDWARGLPWGRWPVGSLAEWRSWGMNPERSGTHLPENLWPRRGDAEDWPRRRRL